MPHQTDLIATIAVGLGLAFVFGLVASRLRLPPLVGYLLAGIIVGPATPGFVADAELAAQLAEIGVMLLMFGVGMHFSIKDLLAVRRIALPGALVQITVATLLGLGLTTVWGWSLGEGLVFGLCLSVASTVVLLRALEERGALDSTNGRIAVGWLIVEDLVTVFALVMLPALAGVLGTGGEGASPAAEEVSLLASLGITLLKLAGFTVVMLFVGPRVVPWVLDRTARTGSRELFTVAILAVALGVAFGAAALFDVSVALGAFFAGMLINESDHSHQVAADALPLQDAFTVLFFVSVGMVFDPMVLVERPGAVLLLLAIIMIGKSLAAFGIVLVFRYPLRTALVVSASLAQIGEFSFILAALAVGRGLLPVEGQSLILAAAILSIALNPVAFALIDPVERWFGARPRLLAVLERPPGDLTELPDQVDEEALRDHVVLCGFGRVGSAIGGTLARQGIPYTVVEQNREMVEELREKGIPAIYGDASRPGLLADAHLERARTLIVATPDAYQTRQIIRLARQLNPGISIVVRTHSLEEQEFLLHQGVGMAVMGEHELAIGMTRYVLESLGIEHTQADQIAHAVRVSPSAPV